MLLAEIPFSTYILMPVLIIACGGTFAAFLVGLLALRKPSRKVAQRLLRIALYSVPFEIGLLLLVLALDSR